MVEAGEEMKPAARGLQTKNGMSLLNSGRAVPRMLGMEELRHDRGPRRAFGFIHNMFDMRLDGRFCDA